MYHALRLTLCALACTLAGCGGGGSDTTPSPAPPPPTEQTGTVIIGLTDAPGDFLSYQVEVTGIRFTAANGAVIETLPEATTIDFAQYVEATELVTAASLPTGAYTAVTLALDYGAAAVMVEDEVGDAVRAVVVDAAGDPLLATEVTVEFAAGDRFIIAPGIPAQVTLDFDLGASHSVDLATSPVAAAFKGVLIADALLEDPKTRRIRGLLRDVNTDTSSFALAVRPFFHPRGDFGPIEIATNEQTAFEIDETAYVGAQGLRALDALAPAVPVVALGEMDRTTRQVTATLVLAGSSVPFGDADIATGSVMARDGDVLTLRGVTLVRDDLSVTFNDTMQVTISASTTIRQQGATLVTLTPADVSVGQVVTVHGTLAGDGTLDAGDGLLRALYATVAGTVRTLSPLQVEVSRINGRRPRLYDFSGTGVDGANDADPRFYDVDSGSLGLAGLDAGDPLRIRGLVAPFGTAPADFVARSIGNVSDVAGRLHLRWQPPGTADAILALDGDGIVLDLDPDALTRIHYLNQAGVYRDLLALGDQLTLQPRASDRGVFALRSDGRLTVYFTFTTFSDALAAALDGSRALRSVRGEVMVSGDNAYTVRRLQVLVE